MIKFFSHEWKPEELLKLMRNTPPEKWPPVDELIDTSKKLPRDTQRVVFALIFDAFSVRTHRQLTDKEQAAIWTGFGDVGLHTPRTRERYIKNRLNNEVMWLPETLRGKVDRKSKRYQTFCRNFYEEKMEEWKEIPPNNLEEWLKECREEFLEQVTST